MALQNSLQNSLGIHAGALMAWLAYGFIVVKCFEAGTFLSIATGIFFLCVLLGMIYGLLWCYIAAISIGRIVGFLILVNANNPFALMDVKAARASMHEFFVACLAAFFASAVINCCLAEQANLRKLQGSEKLTGFP